MEQGADGRWKNCPTGPAASDQETHWSNVTQRLSRWFGQVGKALPGNPEVFAVSPGKYVL